MDGVAYPDSHVEYSSLANPGEVILMVYEVKPDPRTSLIAWLIDSEPRQIADIYLSLEK